MHTRDTTYAGEAIKTPTAPPERISSKLIGLLLVVGSVASILTFIITFVHSI